MNESRTPASRVQVGKPTITTEGVLTVMKLLLTDRISEGEIVNELEIRLADMLKAKHAILFNSGHSALVASYLVAKRIHGCERAVTTALTFLSTASAAVEAGLDLVAIDTMPGGFLINADLAERMIRASSKKCVYVPVHLFGYQATDIQGVFTLQDCCEAFGTGLPDDPVGVPDIGCFSFYTSHVLGCGELGCAITNSDDDSTMLRKIKDQGRTFLRPASHVKTGSVASPALRYSHDTLGYNFRTTDVQAALLLGALAELPRVLQARRRVVRRLNDGLAGVPGIRTPRYDESVSYLAYPIACDSPEIRDKLITGLDEIGVETRPLMSVIPDEAAVSERIAVPGGYKEAAVIHRRSLYVSAHDSLSETDMQRIVEGIKGILK